MNEWTKPKRKGERPILIFFRAEEHGHVQSDKLAEKVDIYTVRYIKVNFIHEKL
jgi:hypothetical protein